MQIASKTKLKERNQANRMLNEKKTGKTKEKAIRFAFGGGEGWDLE